MNPIESSHSSTDLTTAIIDFLNFILILTPPILPLGFAVCMIGIIQISTSILIFRDVVTALLLLLLETISSAWISLAFQGRGSYEMFRATSYIFTRIM